ncbi:MAG: hydrogenase accessory protein HupE [Thiotrichaceae bacterium]|nr:MAG: hydrogenase accessory protein HupE [Thiotrichaceae bacterium]
MTEATIPVTGEIKFNIQFSNELTQNVKPLLHEIKHALDALIETGKTGIIDLRSIPLASGEEDKILNTLGQGEVLAQMNTLGLSEIVETQYAGVWLVTHYNDEGNIISRFIEITAMPEILCSQTEDILSAYSRITEILD